VGREVGLGGVGDALGLLTKAREPTFDSMALDAAGALENEDARLADTLLLQKVEVAAGYDDTGQDRDKDEQDGANVNDAGTAFMCRGFLCHGFASLTTAKAAARSSTAPS